MINSLPACCSLTRRRKLSLYAVALAALLIAPACQTRSSSDEAATRGIIIVNSPAAGEVRRVLVREGMMVNEGTPLVEIAVRTEAQNTPRTQVEDPLARAGRNIGMAQVDIEAARAEVVRAEVEVQRLTPLATSGDVPQAQLDGARATFERAQHRLQQAQAAAQDAQANLVAARQQPRNSAPTPSTPAEQIVTARASSGGTVSVVNARVGERVAAGQPLATLRAEQR